MSEEVTVYKRNEIDRKLGTEDFGPLFQTVMLDDLQVALNRQTALLEKIDEHNKKSEFEGRVKSLSLAANESEQELSLLNTYPFLPWISCTFISDGPAYVIVNHETWTPLFENVPLEVSFAGAKQRIELIYYKCDSGKTAVITVVGKY